MTKSDTQGPMALRAEQHAARPRMSRRRKALFVVVTFGIIFGIPEVLTRIFAPEYTCARFSGTVTGSHPIGPRGADFGRDLALQPKASRETRLVMVGDSVMWGCGLALEDTIPVRVEAKLNTRLPDRPWRCINFAGMGTTPALRRDFLLEQLQIIPADAVVCQFNINDVAWTDAQSAAQIPNKDIGFLAGLFGANFNGLRSRFLRYSAFLTLIEFKARLFMQARRAPLDPAHPGACLAAMVDTPEIRERWDKQFRAMADLKEACQRRGIGFAVYMYPTAESLSDTPRDNPYHVDKSRFTVDPYARFEGYLKEYGLQGRALFTSVKSERDRMTAGRIPYEPLFQEHLGDPNHPSPRGAELFADAIVEDVLAGRIVPLTRNAASPEMARGKP